MKKITKIGLWLTRYFPKKDPSKIYKVILHVKAKYLKLRAFFLPFWTDLAIGM